MVNLGRLKDSFAAIFFIIVLLLIIKYDLDKRNKHLIIIFCVVAFIIDGLFTIYPRLYSVKLSSLFSNYE